MLPSNFVNQSLAYLKADLRLRHPFTFLYSNIWKPIDDRCQEIDGPIRTDIGYDGDAHEVGRGREKTRHVRVFISDRLRYPLQFGFYPADNDRKYLRYINTFASQEELFIYLTGHELRHVWQWENPSAARKIRALLRCTDETDADLYATRTLSAVREHWAVNLAYGT